MTELEIHPFHSPRTNYLAGIVHDLASVLRTDIPVSIPTPSPRQGSFTGTVHDEAAIHVEAAEACSPPVSGWQ